MNISTSLNTLRDHESVKNYTKPGLNKETIRLQTYANWNDSLPDKRLLALIGLYYIGPDDLVKCYFCSVELGMWQPEDNPVAEHLRWAPNCPLLHNRVTTNEPTNVERLKRVLPSFDYNTRERQTAQSSRNSGSGSYAEISINCPNTSNIRDLSSTTSIMHGLPKHPEFALESHRLLSFKDWSKHMKQKPADLAESGFYYTGNSDKVRCFSCDIGLKDWDKSDIPWEQHTMWSSKCSYLKLMKNQEFIDEILMRKMAPLSSTNVPSEESLVKQEHSTKESSSINDNKMCKICYNREYNTVFSPCGHIIACVQCASSVSICPFCRSSFTNIIKVYFP